MKYPKINKKDLDPTNKKRFDALYGALYESIDFDKTENELRLSNKDIDLLAWNAATHIISRPY